jgi:hypothetical protein
MGLAAWGTFAISSHASIGSFVSLMLSIAVAVLIYFAALWLVGEITQEEKLAVLLYVKDVRSKMTGFRK